MEKLLTVLLLSFAVFVITITGRPITTGIQAGQDVFVVDYGPNIYMNTWVCMEKGRVLKYQFVKKPKTGVGIVPKKQSYEL
jgi:hypothetical protein